MSNKIFINYRRGDDPGFTGRLFDHLENHFQQERLFMDVDSIPPGLDFFEVLDEQVAQCDVFLAIIGKDWLNAKNEDGQRRLDQQEDFVRIEIESALKRKIRVIPVLVNAAEMPRQEQLPENLKPLARRNAVRLTHDRFRSDAAGLIKALEIALIEEQQKRVIIEKHQQEVQEHKRLKAIQHRKELEKEQNEKYRLDSIANLTREEIAKAEELANWDFIKSHQVIQEFRDHMERYSGGVTEAYALERLEDLTWHDLGGDTTLETLKEFIEEFPFSEHVEEVGARIKQFEVEKEAAQLETKRVRQERAAWARAVKTGTAEAYKSFLEAWPDSDNFKIATDRIQIKTLHIKASDKLSKVEEPFGHPLSDYQHQQQKNIKPVQLMPFWVGLIGFPFALLVTLVFWLAFIAIFN